MKIIKILIMPALLAAILFSNPFPSHAAVKKTELKLEKSWDYGDDFVTYVYGGIVDDDGHLAGFYATNTDRASLFTPQKRIAFATKGQGPSQLTTACWMTPYKGDLAILEQKTIGKIKIFTKKNGTYVWKENMRLEVGPNFQDSTAAVFYDNKWFLMGIALDLPRGEKPTGNSVPAYRMRVHDRKGKIIKQLIPKSYDINCRYDQIHGFVSERKGKILSAMAHELVVNVICPTQVKVEKTVALEKPIFYKPMPADFYLINAGNRNNMGQYRRDIESWITAYSAITMIVADGDRLVVQVRTCNEKLKRFAMLVYNAETFKLEGVAYTDDLLLAARNGKFYCLAGGHPRYDDETERCVVNIYAIK